MLIQGAQQRVLRDISLQGQAEKLRNRGNQAFGQGKYEEARDLYTQSIDIFEDCRSFSNRSLCAIKIGQKVLREKQIPDKYPKISRRWGDEAASDASKAIELRPTFVKAHYRLAVGKIMCRDLPRAYMFAVKDLKSYSGVDEDEIKPLAHLINKMHDKFNMSEYISNPFASSLEEWESKVYTDAPIRPICFSCSYCFALCPYPEEYERLTEGSRSGGDASCLTCAMSLEDDILHDKDLLDEIEERMRSLILHSC